MIESVSRAKPRFPLLSDLVDRVCDQFESALQAGRSPQIENFVAAHPGIDRQVLLRELIWVEIDFRRDHDETICFSDYYARFPDETAVVDAIRDERAQAANANGIRLRRDPAENVLALLKLGDDAGRRIKQFELISILGQGGFGVVWRARDHQLERDVAVKLPRQDKMSGKDQTLFLQEARAVAKLAHTNIVKVFEVSPDGSGEAFIVSELIEGVSLKEKLRVASYSISDAATLVSKMASALHHAHEHGVVHRDLKPANVLIDLDGEPHVTDFGLAKKDTTSDESLSVAGRVMGTPAYMAPEQAACEHHLIDRRTDVYALGSILYEALTGRNVFRGEMSSLLEQIRDNAPEPPRSIRPEIPKDLEAICLKCLQKDRGRRYQTAQDLADDLHLYLAGETLRGIPAALPDRMHKWFNKHRRWLISVAATFAASLAIAGALAWSFRGQSVATDLRPTDITTTPPGCEITVVRINPETGEPDPQTLQRANRRSPVRMDLLAGDYLVVAVLDEQRFHEVYRRIPALSDSSALRYRNTHFSKGDSEVVKMEPIRIPRPDVTLKMGFVEGTDQLIRPASLEVSDPDTWHIPSFYVDPREISVEDLKQWRVSEFRITSAGPGPFAHMTYFDSVSDLEIQGKRLPSAAEQYYLSKAVCPADDENNILPDNTRIEGLHSGVWEWTSTQPGGPFSGCSSNHKIFGSAALPRMIGCGDEIEAKSILLVNGQMVEYEQRSTVAGARGVRSAKPRRTLKDFASPIKLFAENKKKPQSLERIARR